MKALFLLILTLPLSAQFFPFPGPGRAPSGGGGGGGSSATFKGVSSLNDNSNVASISTPGSLSIASGDLIVVLVTHAGTSTTTPTTTVACGSNSLTQAKVWFASNYVVKAFYKENATAGTTGCTATLGSAQSFNSITAANYSGVATTSALKQSSCNDASCSALAASSTNRTAQNVTTVDTNTVLIAFGIDWNGGVTHTAQNGYTLRYDGETPFLLDKSVNATGSYPAGNFSTTNSADQYASIFLVFGLL